MKNVFYALIFILSASAAYLGLWPVPVNPVSWQAPAAPGYSGVHAVNEFLAGLTIVPLAESEGPEHIALAPDSRLYAAVAGGSILRMNQDGSAQEVFVRTGGRVLGFDFDAAGNLIAADAVKGLLSIGPDRRITVLANSIAGIPIGYANSVVVAENAKIYFSDSSTRFFPAKWGGTFEASILDIIEQSSTGRILEYDPATGSTRIVAQGLSFANGVALSSDQETLLVSETGRYRVWKIAVSADNLTVTAGGTQSSILLDNLPGFPDNLMRGLNGRIWLGFAKPRNPAIDAMADKPYLRKLTLRLPRSLWPVPRPYGHVMAFTEDGQVVADLQDPSGAYPETTGVTEIKGRLYIQSLHATGLGWQEIDDPSLALTRR